MEKSPLAKSSHTIDDETSERTFKIWDNNHDGFIEPVEVRGLIYSIPSLPIMANNAEQFDMSLSNDITH